MTEPDAPEISDLIGAHALETLERLPVVKADVVALFRSAKNETAARIVERMPEQGGVLDPREVDRLLVRVHVEMQRLSEEMQHGARVAELLRPLLEALRASG